MNTNLRWRISIIEHQRLDWFLYLIDLQTRCTFTRSSIYSRVLSGLVVANWLAREPQATSIASWYCYQNCIHHHHRIPLPLKIPLEIHLPIPNYKLNFHRFGIPAQINCLPPQNSFALKQISLIHYHNSVCYKNNCACSRFVSWLNGNINSISSPRSLHSKQWWIELGT